MKFYCDKQRDPFYDNLFDTFTANNVTSFCNGSCDASCNKPYYPVLRQIMDLVLQQAVLWVSEPAIPAIGFVTRPMRSCLRQVV